MNLSDENLASLHSASANKNVPWKAQCLAKNLFNAGFHNASVLSARAKICENAYASAIAVYFAKVYLGEDGTYNHQAFTKDILLAITAKANQAGQNEERARHAPADAPMG